MANSIIHKPHDIVFSSAIGNIGISTDFRYINVLLTTPTGRELMNERFYPDSNGKFMVYDVGSLIETDMRANREVIAEYSLSIYAVEPESPVDTATFQVLYCDRFTLADKALDFYEKNFLTTCPTRRIPRGVNANVFALVDGGEELFYEVEGILRSTDGSLVTASFTRFFHEADRRQVFGISLSYDTLMKKFADALDMPQEHLTLLSFTVHSEFRSATFWIDPSLRAEENFVFRNCFNVWEDVYLPCQTTAKTEVETSEASINGYVSQYDRSTVKTFDVQTGSLTADEASLLEQMVASHEIYRYIFNLGNEENPTVDEPVLITESTCELSDGDDKPNSLKFSWRFANKRQFVGLPLATTAFSTNFNNQFE